MKLPNIAYKKYLRFVGIIVFIIILLQIDIDKLAKVLYEVSNNISIFIFAILINIPYIMLKICRWKRILDLQNIDLSLSKAIYIYVYTICYAALTPGRMGDFLRVVFIKKSHPKVSYAKALSNVIVDRWMDITALILTACLASTLAIVPKTIAWYIVAITIIFFGVSLFILKKRNFYKPVLSFVCNRFNLQNHHEKVEVNIDKLYQGIDKLINLKALYPLFLSFGAYSVLFFQSYLLCHSLNIRISFLQIASFISMANILSFLPITISGIGTRDMVLVTMFNTIGLTSEAALGVSVSFFLVVHVLLTGISALLGYIKPFNLDNTSKLCMEETPLEKA
jgi:hypothetical protein